MHHLCTVSGTNFTKYIMINTFGPFCMHQLWYTLPLTNSGIPYLSIFIFSEGYRRYLALGLTLSVCTYVSMCVSVCVSVCPFVGLHCGCVLPLGKYVCPFVGLHCGCVPILTIPGRGGAYLAPPPDIFVCSF